MEQVKMVSEELTINLTPSMLTVHASWSAAKTAALIRQTIFSHGQAVCPACLVHKRFKTLKDGRYWCSDCRKKYSLKILAGFKGSKLSLETIALLCRCFLKNYPLNVAQDVTGLSYPTVRRYYSSFRKKAAQFMKERVTFLSGKVAIDACYIGHRRNENQSIVLGVVQRNYANLAFRIVAEEDQGCVEKFLYDTTNPWSHVIHDGHKAYEDLSWTGVTHEAEFHNLNQFKKTSPIERIWALLVTMLRRTYHHVTKEKLPEYLTEFRFKFLYRSTGKNQRQFLNFLTLPAPSAC